MLSKKAPQDDPRLEKLKYWCKIFHENWLAPPYEGGSYGNLSFRIRHGYKFIITASSSSLENAQFSNEYFSKVHVVNNFKFLIWALILVWASGKREPSSEAPLHSAIYIKRPDVEAIFHGHSPKISANAKSLNIVETIEEKPYGSAELVKEVLKVLGKENFLEMKNHGFISLGQSMDEAGNLALRMLEKCNQK